MITNSSCFQSCLSSSAFCFLSFNSCIAVSLHTFRASPNLSILSSITSSTITVGTGGAGIASAGTPTAGGDSSWADGTNTITGGGSPASSNSSSASGFRGGAGGVASGGDINIDGGGSFSDVSDSGSFGMSVLGQEGFGARNSLSYQPTTALMNGVGYGGGGGGRTSGAASPTSGAGANGVVIVWEYK